MKTRRVAAGVDRTKAPEAVAFDPVPGPDAPAPLTADTLLGGRYRIVRPVASGGMAAVYEGRDEILARSVAVKVLHPHLAADQVFLERFRREAISAARLSHPNIVATFDAGTAANGTAYIVMELVRGTTLRHHLTQGGMPPGLAVSIAIQIADALRHAHAAGLVHRDIKPGNVLLCQGETDATPHVKVTDFGIAKAAAGMGLDLTMTGMVVGTPKYLSPEQVEGREPDVRADLYALGVVIFEMLTGDPPFTGPTDMATALARLDGPAPRLAARCRGLPPELDRLVAALMARDPDDRPPSATAVRQALASIPAIGTARPVAPVNGADLTTVGNAKTTVAPARPGSTAPTGVLHPGSASASASASRGAKTTTASYMAPTSSGVGLPGRPPTGPGGPAGSGRPGPASGGGGSNRRPTGGPNGPVKGRPPRRSRWPGRVVGVLVAATAIVAGVILSGHGARPTPGAPAAIQGGGGVAPGSTIGIGDVSVFHLERDADGAALVGKTHDGNPATMWTTDHYFGPNFAGLRHGLGLAITLDGTHRVHQLKVESPTIGWSAQVYLAAQVPGQASLAPWGQAVAVKQGINGAVTFDLGGRQAGAILLWITDLGPAYKAAIAELAVT
jgi:eukaryotic-like serine/threonine-protein kinase